MTAYDPHNPNHLDLFFAHQGVVEGHLIVSFSEPGVAPELIEAPAGALGVNELLALMTPPAGAPLSRWIAWLRGVALVRGAHDLSGFAHVLAGARRKSGI